MRSLLFSFLVFCFACQPTPKEFQPNYNEENIPSYELPPVLITESSDAINKKEDWQSKRRPEILELFETNVYGKMPDKRITASFQLKTRMDNALKGKAIQKEVILQFTNGEDTVQANLLIFLPDTSTQPASLFLAYNFNGNHTIHADSNISITNKKCNLDFS